MQAWQQVKISNEDSGYIGQAGFVVRVEQDADKEVVFVRMDTDLTVQPFSATELQILG